jgi:hypothetical protein
VPHQDEHLPEQIEADVHQFGFGPQRLLFQGRIGTTDQNPTFDDL